MFYVTMTDKCLSGWGGAAGKIYKLVLTCNAIEETEIVMENAKNRKDMNYINCTTKKPYYNSKKYLIHYADRDEYENWYKKDFFSNIEKHN